MTTTISSKGQIVLPAEFRRKDGLRAGQSFEVERVEDGKYLLKRISPPPNEGLVDWLLACPVKGFLNEPDRSETTDDIRPDFR